MSTPPNKRISGLVRDFHGFRSELERFTNFLYPDILGDLNDASVGSWFLDLNASVSDNLSYYIDRAFQETNINEGQLRRSLLNIARTKGLKIPGLKASLVEVEVSADVPLDDEGRPHPAYLPIIRAGSQASGNGNTFEFISDCDFSNQFNQQGISNRQIVPRRNSNGVIESYIVKKREVLSGSQTKVFSMVIDDFFVRPFAEIVLPDPNVLSIDSIIFKEGTNFLYSPSSQDFTIQTEFCVHTADQKPTWRYFEVDSLLQDKIFLPEMTQVPTGVNDYPRPRIIHDVLGSDPQYSVSITPGYWKRLQQKFITEYTDRGFLKIIFGAGSDYALGADEEELSVGQEQIRRVINNDNMGILPNPGWTCWIRYRVGGGESSNVAPNTINQLTFRNVEIRGIGGESEEDASRRGMVDRSIRITNTTPSVSGKDAPSNAEIRYMIKYNNLSQNRVVTIQDYRDRINKMPPMYGTPFRFGVIERNNIIYISILGIDSNGYLTDEISSVLLNNMSNYLSEYKMLTDYVLIKPGRIVNLGVELDLVINQGYSENDVVRNVIQTTNNFFSVRNRIMGEDIFTSQLLRELMSVSGVENLIDLRIFNMFNGEYSQNRISQAIIAGRFGDGGVWEQVNEDTNRVEVDLEASDGILFSDYNTMFELRNINEIKIRIKRV